MSRPILLVTAPTGAGKTKLFQELDPSRFEILSFDSRQIYQELPIGTAAPTEEEQKRITHHLVGLISPSEEIHAGKYLEMAEISLQKVLSIGKIPVLSAGTGFYLNAFLFGMFPVPKIDPEVKKTVENLSMEERILRLQELDPKALVRIFKNDNYRYGRALEVNLMGVRWSELKADPKDGILQKYDLTIALGFYLNLERTELYRRINERAKQMIEMGMAEEAKKVAEKYGEDCPGLHSLGYNFALENIKGMSNLESFLGNLSQSHRNYAKRQIAWFRNQPFLAPVDPKAAYEQIQKI
ncbi:tRNA (adenosine(37)-N6)-dimethylallyltransferase MiaA [Leptospira perolatii]|uniref:tRNA dimethylallyltransferase n=1 Tax=Leptospira perolatii TaxID=2023191 RepID=A0A2M9ZQ33_9LEPT|nr:tRNA (adenosine(37)-N6)-dimethylallyltransferase MiaA [Leptospira perolatii]PJZ68050.1 tRNA (adenosine(37)-N6)-dimethylallyltransferase MiaA [Leptospira perolatii]PJZ74198.1 tRNA (adenosine(37)-N6)-dimethylallyltransferase MiaA [Leptospira perolatii]